jgi:hypothetical protein
MTTLVLPADGDVNWGSKARTAWNTTIAVADGAAADAGAALPGTIVDTTGAPVTGHAVVVIDPSGLIDDIQFVGD